MMNSNNTMVYLASFQPGFGTTKRYIGVYASRRGAINALINYLIKRNKIDFHKLRKQAGFNDETSSQWFVNYIADKMEECGWCDFADIESKLSNALRQAGARDNWTMFVNEVKYTEDVPELLDLPAPVSSDDSDQDDIAVSPADDNTSGYES